MLTLYLGGIRIQTIDVLSLNFDLGYPSIQFSLLGFPVDLALPSLLVTMLWFLGCMNVWNLIDGMDGLASGVGLLVSGTLTLVAIHNENFEVGGPGGRAGGQPGGVLALQLASRLHLPGRQRQLADRALDRRDRRPGLDEGAVGDLDPVSDPGDGAADLGHGHGDLPPLGAQPALERGRPAARPSPADRAWGSNPRQAALLLYCFSGFLCGAVMLGVALRNEYLTLILGISGCLAFLLVVTSRRDELTNLRDDLQDRMTRGRQERQAAKLTWEAIQRIELCTTEQAACAVVDETAHALGCAWVHIAQRRRAAKTASAERNPAVAADFDTLMSGPSAIFRLSGGRDLLDHGRAGLGDGVIAGGRHRLSLLAAAVPGTGGAAEVGLIRQRPTQTDGLASS